MQYLVIFTPKEEFRTEGMPSDFAATELQEQAQTRVLYAGNELRQVWAKVPREHGAVTLFEAETPGKLQSLIESFPLIQAKYADFEILPLQPHAAFLPPDQK